MEYAHLRLSGKDVIVYADQNPEKTPGYIPPRTKDKPGSRVNGIIIYPIDMRRITQALTLVLKYRLMFQTNLSQKHKMCRLFL